MKTYLPVKCILENSAFCVLFLKIDSYRGLNFCHKFVLHWCYSKITYIFVYCIYCTSSFFFSKNRVTPWFLQQSILVYCTGSLALASHITYCTRPKQHGSTQLKTDTRQIALPTTQANHTRVSCSTPNKITLPATDLLMRKRFLTTREDQPDANFGVWRSPRGKTTGRPNSIN